MSATQPARVSSADGATIAFERRGNGPAVIPIGETFNPARPRM